MAEWDGTPPGPECGMSAPDSGAGLDESVRPRSLDDFIGQDELRANLRVYLDAARERDDLDDGEVRIYAEDGRASITLRRNGHVEIEGDLFINGAMYVPPVS